MCRPFNMTALNAFLPPASEVWGKVICLQACVCPRGEYLARYTSPVDQVAPRSRHPPPRSRHHPPGTRCPPEQTPPWDQVHPPEHTPQEQTPLPGSRHPPRTRYNPLGSRHPPRHTACWEIRSTRGRYASY